MIEPQPITPIDRSELVAKATQFSKDGYRIVQVCCTTGQESLELTYSFDKDYTFANLRVTVPKTDAVIPSITGAYLAAFAYENELQDLFGLKVTDLAINYNGKFYKTAIPTPFNQKKTN
jgi:ech hydrogenase subunit D